MSVTQEAADCIRGFGWRAYLPTVSTSVRYFGGITTPTVSSRLA
jgi:hypothetical protein